MFWTEYGEGISNFPEEIEEHQPAGKRQGCARPRLVYVWNWKKKHMRIF